MNIKTVITGMAVSLALTAVPSGACGAVTSEKALQTSAKHTETTAYNWYCKNNDTHTPPPLPEEYGFVTQNGGYYLDTRAKEEDKVIYLTFDAGYENGNVEKILNVLKKHNATGAFFVLGNIIKRNTELVKRMVCEGNLVCNHTNLHRDMTKCRNAENFKAELDALNSIMLEYCGCELAPFYRPPEGRFSEQNLKYAKECGYKTIFWSYAYADWDNNRQPDCEKAKNKVLSHTHNGEVILLHPTSSTNAAILDDLMTEWERQGYRFGSLYELTKDL